MEFKNITSKDVKIRVGGDRDKAVWKTVKAGGIVDISETLGIKNNFEKVIDKEKLKAEAKAKIKAEKEAKAEAEAKVKAEEEAKKKAEEDAKAKADEESKSKGR